MKGCFQVYVEMDLVSVRAILIWFVKQLTTVFIRTSPFYENVFLVLGHNLQTHGTCETLP